MKAVVLGSVQPRSICLDPALESDTTTRTRAAEQNRELQCTSATLDACAWVAGNAASFDEGMFLVMSLAIKIKNVYIRTLGSSRRRPQPPRKRIPILMEPLTYDTCINP